MGPAPVVLGEGEIFHQQQYDWVWSNQDYTEGYTDPQRRSLIVKTVKCKNSPVVFYLTICKQDDSETPILFNRLTGSPMSPRAPGFPFGPGLP